MQANCRECKLINVIPLRGCAPTASQTPLNARTKAKSEKRRGDHWIEKLSGRTKAKWLEFDASYLKQKLHKGLKTPIGTSECISLWQSSTEHTMVAEHCYAETPAWTTAQRANDITNGCYSRPLKPGADNHCFDNLCGCLTLLNYGGTSFADVATTAKKRKSVKGSEMQQRKREERVRSL